MPTITSQARPVITASTEEHYINPRKTITQPTGMDVKKTFSGVEGVQEPRQPNTSVETNPQDPPKEVTLSPQLTALARKEQALRQREQAIKADRDAIEKQKSDFGKLTELKDKLSKKDYSILDELGVSYEEWTNYLLNKANGEKPEVQAVKQLESRIDQFEENQKQLVTKQYDQTIKQYERDIKNKTESDPAFGAIKKLGAEKHVLQHILDTFNEEGEALSVDQACKDIQDFLEDERKQYDAAFTSKSEETPKEKVLPPPKQTRTLTQQIAQVDPSVPRNQFQHMSMKERVLKAAQIANSKQR
jgi:tetratricopeptide (TPR) repeat protein